MTVPAAIALDVLAFRADPVRLALRAGLEPDDWQARILRNRVRHLILNCSRQSGKSTLAAVLAVAEMILYGPALVLLVAPSLRQSQELYRTLRALLAALGGTAPAATRETALTVELQNGSRCVVLPGGDEKTVRGYANVTLCVVDEASRIDNELYAALAPMLAVSGGRMILLSTPWGKRGVFYNVWMEGGEEWHRVRLPATECPRISLEFLDEQRRSLPQHVFMQEYMCEFADSDCQIFATDIIRRAITNRIKPLFAA